MTKETQYILQTIKKKQYNIKRTCNNKQKNSRSNAKENNMKKEKEALGIVIKQLLEKETPENQKIITDFMTKITFTYITVIELEKVLETFKDEPKRKTTKKKSRKRT